jgi:hypothetical protein
MDLKMSRKKIGGTLSGPVAGDVGASAATLAKGIAHELNNPINYVAGRRA